MAARSRKPAAATPAAAPIPAPSSDAPHWQVARLAAPGQVFTATDTRGAETRVVADSRGVVFPRSIEELRLVDSLPVAPAAVLAAPAQDVGDDAGDEVPPTEPSDDAGDETGEED